MFSTPGKWNDPGLLLIGNHLMTLDEERTQMALWAIAKAPLIMSVDLSQASTDSVDILKNQLLIQIN